MSASILLALIPAIPLTVAASVAAWRSIALYYDRIDRAEREAHMAKTAATMREMNEATAKSIERSVTAALGASHLTAKVVPFRPDNNPAA